MDRTAKDGVAVKSRTKQTKPVPVHPVGALRASAKAVLDITVLMGGPSTEREVSFITGAAIADALERNGHSVTRCDISPEDVSPLDRQGMDLVFIALHGDFGESGQVQRLCEERGLRYIGSPPRASEMAMDKAVAKDVFSKAGLLVPDGELIDASNRDRAGELVERLSLPVVVKPVDGGSSVDVFIARTQAQRDEAIACLLSKYGKALVEQFIKGRELTVGVLGDQALPVIEIVPDGQFYDYRAKYSDDAKTSYMFEHGLEDSVVRKIQAAALKGFASLGCRDISRLDFILDEQGNAWLLEINTIPGFTSHSLLPKAAAKAGISFDQLVQRIVDMAMSR